MYVALQLGPVHGDAVLGPAAFVGAAGIGVAWARWVGRADRHVRWAWTIWVIALAFGVGRVAGRPGGAGRAHPGRWPAGRLRRVRDRRRDERRRVAPRARGPPRRDASHPRPATTSACGRCSTGSCCSPSRGRSGSSSPETRGRRSWPRRSSPRSSSSAARSSPSALGRLESLGASAGVDWRRNRAWVLLVGGVIVADPRGLGAGRLPRRCAARRGARPALGARRDGRRARSPSSPRSSPPRCSPAFEALISALPTPVPTPVPSPSGSALAGRRDRGRGARAIRASASRSRSSCSSRSPSPSSTSSAGRGPAADGAPCACRRIAGHPRSARSSSRGSGRTPPRSGPGSGARAPTTATAAYLAVLESVAHDPILARRPGESPRAHGRRLSALQVLGPGATDTRPRHVAARRRLGARALRGRTLTAAEDRRGVARWRRLAGALRRGAAGPDAAPGTRSGDRPRV